jgi:hypothetical protein
MTHSLYGPDKDSGPKNFQYWQQLRKQDPRRYYASSTQREMIEAREVLGEEAFYAPSR